MTLSNDGRKISKKSVHLSIFRHLSRVAQTSLFPATSSSTSRGSWRGQARNIVSPACPRLSLGPSTSGTCPEYLIRETVGGIWTMFLSHLIWLYSMRRSVGSTPSSSWMTMLLTLSLREPSQPLEETYFCHLYLQLCSFNHYPKLVNIGEGMKIDP